MSVICCTFCFNPDNHPPSLVVVSFTFTKLTFPNLEKDYILIVSLTGQGRSDAVLFMYVAELKDRLTQQTPLSSLVGEACTSGQPTSFCYCMLSKQHLSVFFDKFETIKKIPTFVFVTADFKKRPLSRCLCTIDL